MAQNYIMIKNDNEGFFGSESTEKINIQASINAYETELTEAIREVYTPDELEINHEYGSYTGASIICDDDDIADVVENIVERVYNRGTFWVYKNPAAVALGRMGGSVKGGVKAQKSAANGRKGGRPRKQQAAQDPDLCLECGGADGQHYAICSQSN